MGDDIMEEKIRDILVVVFIKCVAGMSTFDVLYLKWFDLYEVSKFCYWEDSHKYYFLNGNGNFYKSKLHA